MKKLNQIFLLSLALIVICVQGCRGWGWKRATTPNDMMNFLRTTPPYTQKIYRAEITGTLKNSQDDFIAFYQSGEGGDSSSSWGWKRATEPNDMMNFLSTTEPYTQIIKRAEITAMDKGSYVDFIVFYQTGDSSDPQGGWGWKRATSPDDVMNFLNTTAPYTQIIKRADITAVDKGSYIDFIVFYQPGDSSDPHGGWGWKKSTEPNDVKDFLSGDGAYNQPVVSAEIAAIDKQAYTEFYVFYTR
jgi:hypothetical protein